MRSKRKTLTIPEEQYWELRKLAKDMETTINGVIAYLLKKKLKSRNRYSFGYLKVGESVIAPHPAGWTHGKKPQISGVLRALRRDSQKFGHKYIWDYTIIGLKVKRIG